jgi:hypothetical protein
MYAIDRACMVSFVSPYSAGSSVDFDWLVGWEEARKINKKHFI